MGVEWSEYPKIGDVIAVRPLWGPTLIYKQDTLIGYEIRRRPKASKAAAHANQVEI